MTFHLTLLCRILYGNGYISLNDGLAACTSIPNETTEFVWTETPGNLSFCFDFAYLSFLYESKRHHLKKCK